MATKLAKKKPSRKARGKKVKESMAVAMHETDGNGHVVGVGNIRVLVCQDGDKTWLAQGLEIDYLATGDSAEEAKTNFEIGLRETIDLHVNIHQNLKHFLRVAPQSVWDSLQGLGNEYSYSQVSFHEDVFKKIPYPGINFFEETEEAAA